LSRKTSASAAAATTTAATGGWRNRDLSDARVVVAAVLARRDRARALAAHAYFGDAVVSGPRLAADALMSCLAARSLATAALLRGIEGFGINRRIHAQRFPDVSTDLPLLAMAVDERDRIRAVLDDVEQTVPRGLVTLERARLATGEDVARAEIPKGPGKAAKLTIYCGSDDRAGRRPAFREAVAVLRRCGASGAIVLAGVDGVLFGRRRRARLFRIGGAPMVIISVRPAGPLRRSLPQLAELLPRPVGHSRGSRSSSTTASCSSHPRASRARHCTAATSGRRSGCTRGGPRRSTVTCSTAS
jgi:PII-like signaling protein